MLNAANINLIAFSYLWGNITGQTFGLFVMALAAAEVAIGIGIILVLYRNFDNVDVTDATTMRW
jgi:NADH:ubiquinone oxidoreductase subunit K